MPAFNPNPALLRSLCLNDSGKSITLPTHEEIRVKSQSGLCDKLEFQLLHCQFDYYAKTVVGRGRTRDGDSVFAYFEHFTPYFFIELKEPWRDLEDVNTRLHKLIWAYFDTGDFSVVDFNGKRREQYGVKVAPFGRSNNPASITPDQLLVAWQWFPGDSYKTLYGYTPPTHYENVVKIWTKCPEFGQSFHNWLESEEYNNLLADNSDLCFARTWEATIDLALRLRIDYHIQIGRWCSTTAYTAITPAKRRFICDKEVIIGSNYLYCDWEDESIAPLRILSFDIECAGRVPDEGGDPRFPVPLWTAERCRDYIARNFSRPVPYTVPDEPIDIVRWADRQHFENYDKKRIDLNDTDPAIIICGVIRVFGQDSELAFSKHVALVYEHPDAESPLDTHARDAVDSFSKTWKYADIELIVVSSEAELLLAFERFIHTTKPDIITGWNTERFDFPYLWDRADWLRVFGTTRDNALLEELNFGLDTKRRSKIRVKFSSTRAGGDNMARLVTTPWIDHSDGITVWRHPSYGQPKEPSFRLTDVSAKHLSYNNAAIGTAWDSEEDAISISDTNYPMRKLEFDIREGVERWKKGGRALWEFVVYCYVDACLPVLLLEKRGKIRLQVALARATNVNTTAIYNSGVQMKLLALIYCFCRKLFDGQYLVPDRGYHHVHWPDVWAWPKGVRDALRTLPRLRPKKENEATYIGAKVFEPLVRGIISEPVATEDFTSLYPSIMNAYGLCYTTFLTEMTIKRFGLRRMQYMETILGPSDLIYPGEVLLVSPETAMRDGYTSNRVKVARWMHKPDNIFGNIIKSLFDSRLEAKKRLKSAASATHQLNDLLKYLKTLSPTTPTTALLEPADYSRIQEVWKKVPKIHLTAAIETILPSDGSMPTIERGIEIVSSSAELAHNSELNADNAQLSFKLSLNSLYGFTTVSDVQGLLPLAELGATVTAIGRREIRRAATISERLTGPETRLIYEELTRVNILRKNSGLAPFSLSQYLEDAYEPYSRADYGKSRDSSPPIKVGQKRPRDTGKSAPFLAHHGFLEEIGEETREKTAAPRRKKARIQTRVDCFGLRSLPEEIDTTLPLLSENGFQVVYGDTDSVMVKYPSNMGSLEQIGFASDFICYHINRYMLGMMSIVPEKTAAGMLLFKRKKYIMRLVDPNRPADVDFLWKGVEPQRRDTLQWANKCITHCTERLLNSVGESIQNAPPNPDMARWLDTAPTAATTPALDKDVSRHATSYDTAVLSRQLATQVELKKIEAFLEEKFFKFAVGKVKPEDITLCKRYSKVHYKNTPEHLGAVAKRRARGENVNVGERIPYLFVYPKDCQQANGKTMRFNSFKGMDLAEDPSHALTHKLEIAYDHIWKTKAERPITRFLRHILAPVVDFPDKDDETMTPYHQALAKKEQERMENRQDAKLRKRLYKYLNARFDFRKRVKGQNASRQFVSGGSHLLNYFKPIANQPNRKCSGIAKPRQSLRGSITAAPIHPPEPEVQRRTPSTRHNAECVLCYAYFYSPLADGPSGRRTRLCSACQSNRTTLQRQAEEKLKKLEIARAEAHATCLRCIRLAGVPDVVPSQCKLFTCPVHQRHSSLAKKTQLTNQQLELLICDW